MTFCPLRKDLSAACGHSSNVGKPPSLGKTGNATSDSSSLLQRCSSIVFSQVVFTMKHEFGAGSHLCLSKEPVCCKSALWMSQSSVQSLVRPSKVQRRRTSLFQPRPCCVPIQYIVQSEASLPDVDSNSRKHGRRRSPLPQAGSPTLCVPCESCSTSLVLSKSLVLVVFA